MTREPGDPRPDTKVFVPYWSGDDGDRSTGFPSTVTWWWCDGIRIHLPDGTLYTGGVLPRDAASSVSIRVANSGSAPAWASVRTFWTEPAAGFGPPNLRSGPLFTVPFRSLRVPAATTVTTDPVPFTPADDTPDHICIIAVVSAFQDEPDGTWDVATDSHYAQHNVSIVHLDPESAQVVGFTAKNPFPEFDARVTVRIAPAPRERVEALAEVYGAEPVEVDAGSLGVSTERGGSRGSELEVELGPGAGAECFAVLGPGLVPPGAFSVVEVRTTASSPHSEQPDREGVLGFVVLPPER